MDEQLATLEESRSRLTELALQYAPGVLAATAILASSKKQEIFGKCFAAVGIVESFALFAMVFGLIITGGI